MDIVVSQGRVREIVARWEERVHGDQRITLDERLRGGMLVWACVWLRGVASYPIYRCLPGCDLH
jgi:hypothetical protein